MKLVYYYLYVLLDLFSCFVVGWMIAPRESTELAQVLISKTCTRQNIQPQQLTIHADREAVMVAKPLTALLTDLGVHEGHFRPHASPWHHCDISNDNPFSESQFKTMKYSPTDPGCFGSLPDARAWAQNF